MSTLETTIPKDSIQVCNPVIVPGLIQTNNYTVYKVHSNLYGESSVDRRYSEFIWLRDTLVYEFNLCIIPPLPPKQQLGRFEDTFIESRRSGLEKFLCRLIVNPELRCSSALKSFLTLNNSELSEMIHFESDFEKDYLNSNNWMGQLMDSTTQVSTSYR
jgi:sorting nexin-1/2